MEKPVMTIGIFAHANAGKTTITEQLLYHTNTKSKRGRVDHGDTTTDNLQIEQERGISVRSSMVSIDIPDRELQLIDTPGHVDFSAEVERSISVLDGAVLVISGVEGVEPQTQVIWRILQERKVPTIFFINKMDRLGADYNRTLSELREKLNASIIPIIEVDVDLKTRELSYVKPSEEKMTELVAETDDDLINKYLDDIPISKEEIDKTLTTKSREGQVSVALGGSALNDEGIERLISAIQKYLPTAKGPKSDKFSGYVYTVKRDSGVRELYVKVLNGTLENRIEFTNADGNKERVRTISKIVGDKKVRKETLETGEIGIITGLSAHCGDIIGAPFPSFTPASFVNPLYNTTIKPQNPMQINALISALEVLNDEDPDLHLRYNKLTSQISIDLMGKLQGEVISNILQTRFGIDVMLSDPIVVCKETPIEEGFGEANYTRVSGVGFRIRPLPYGSGIKYKSSVSTDYLFTKYQRQVERLVKHYIHQGLYGWKLTDAEIELVSGFCDNVGSEPMHYNIAVPIALMRALKNAQTNILEPNIKYEITTPNEYLKPLIALTSNYGLLYDDISIKVKNSILTGIAPLQSIANLPTNVTKLSNGFASIIEEPCGYTVKKDGEITEREYVGPDPRNEGAFLLDMGAIPSNLDYIRRKR